MNLSGLEKPQCNSNKNASEFSEAFLFLEVGTGFEPV